MPKWQEHNICYGRVRNPYLGNFKFYKVIYSDDMSILKAKEVSEIPPRSSNMGIFDSVQALLDEVKEYFTDDGDDS